MVKSLYTILLFLAAVLWNEATASSDHVTASARRVSRRLGRKSRGLIPSETEHRRSQPGATVLANFNDHFRGGAAGGRTTPTVAQREMLRWFKPGASRREKWLAIWLLLWNSVAFTDAVLFTFYPKRNLNGYLLGEWGPHTLAMTRMLANCQWGVILSTTLIALEGNEAMIKRMFKILILCTVGAFRAVGLGVAEGTIKAPWKTGQAFLMSAPPLLLLLYFAFVF